MHKWLSLQRFLLLLLVRNYFVFAIISRLFVAMIIEKNVSEIKMQFFKQNIISGIKEMLRMSIRN